MFFHHLTGKQANKEVENKINPPQPVQPPVQLPNDRNLPLSTQPPQSSIPPEFQTFIKDSKSTPNFVANQSQTMYEQISQLKIDSNSYSNSYSTTSYYHQQQSTWKQGDPIKTNNSYNSLYNNNSNLNQSNNSPLKQQQSKERESLDSRIEHLIKKQGFANSFLGELSGLSNLSPSFESTSKYKHENDYNQRSNYKSSKESFHTSFHSEQIICTPPSPFLSASDYIKWGKVTQAIDEGRNPSLTDDEDQNEFNNPSSNEYSCDDDLFNEKVNDKQCTPRQRSSMRKRYNNNKNLNKINSSSSINKYDELDDDRMSLSSLSSGEKLELPEDSDRVSFTRKGFVPFTINSNDSGLKRTKSNSYWTKSSMTTNSSIDIVKINNKNQNFKLQISNLNNSSFLDSKHYRPNHLSSNKFNDVFDSYDDHGQMVEDKNKLKRSRLQNLKQGVLKIVIAELKGIIQKDINKKMIESTAFQIYENWWDESEKQFKLKKEQKENQENLNSTSAVCDKAPSSTITNKTPAYQEDSTAWSSVLSAVSYNKTNNSNPFLSEGYQYGHLRAAMPKMPSFKRKVKQTRNEDNQKSDYYKKGGFSDEEFEKISSDDGSFVNEKKYAKVKNRSAAIIDNDFESLSSDDESTSNLSARKFRDHKRKQKKSKSSLSGSSSSLSTSSGSFSSSASSSSSSAGETDSGGSEGDEESGSESDRSSASKKSDISSEVSSLESYDRNKHIKTITKPSSKSSLLSSISQSSISSKSFSSHESSSAYESEEDTKAIDKISSLVDRQEEEEEKEDELIKSKKIDKEQREPEVEKKHLEKELEKEEESVSEPVIDKPVKRKVGRPPKATKQQKATTNKEDKSTNATKSNEKENVKPLKKRKEMFNDEQNENELMTREEIEASEALMALSGFFPSSKQQQNEIGTAIQSTNLSQPKPVIILSDQMSSKQSATYETNSAAETDSASESEFMKTVFETPEESVAFDHSYCIPRNDLIRPRSKYVTNDFSTVFDDDDPTDIKYSDHMYNKIQSSKLLAKKKQQAQQQATAAEHGKKGKKIKAPKQPIVNDENIDLTAVIKKPEIKFPPRSRELEQEILCDFIQNGIDSEDVRYLKRSYDTLLQEDTNYKWLNESHWSDHPPTKITQPSKKKKKTEDWRVHLSGCARSEGYYKMTDKEKEKSSYVVNQVQENADEENENEDSAKVLRARMPTSTQQSTREARSNQRRLLATLEDVAWSDLLKFNQLQFRKKQLKFARSRIHDWGLFALEPIAADEMVIEYVGQQIRPIVADLREKKYNEMGIGSSYLFRVDLETIIDATKVGNLARFINHSCTVRIHCFDLFVFYCESRTNFKRFHFHSTSQTVMQK